MFLIGAPRLIPLHDIRLHGPGYRGYKPYRKCTVVEGGGLNRRGKWLLSPGYKPCRSCSVLEGGLKRKIGGGRGGGGEGGEWNGQCEAECGRDKKITFA